MANKTAPQEIIGIDLLRAFAALGVFYYHSHLGAMLAKYTGIRFFNVTDGFGAMYAVPLFFLISGYCIHASNIKYLKTNASLPLKKYYKRRLLRIYPAYFAALIIAIGVNYYTSPNYKLNGNDFLIHCLSLQGFSVFYFNTINLVLWTITIELAFYAIYPVFYYTRLRYGLNYSLAFVFVVSCLSIFYFQLKGNITPPQRFWVLNLWFAWCCGAFLADKKMIQHTRFNKPVYLLIYGFILAAFLCLNFVPNSLDIITDQFNILFWTAPLLLMLSAESWLRRNQNLWVIKILAAIGISSYSLYLLHEPLIALKNFFVHKYFAAPLQLMGVAAGVLVIPVVAWYSYKFFEKPFISRKRIIGHAA